jgi:hypothetical protein
VPDKRANRTSEIPLELHVLLRVGTDGTFSIFFPRCPNGSGDRRRMAFPLRSGSTQRVGPFASESV